MVTHHASGKKGAFWQALLFAMVVFMLGVLAGYLLEKSRSDRIELLFAHAELNLLDEQIRNQLVEQSNVSCDLTVKSTFAFADRIYEEALTLERLDTASKLTSDLQLAHKRYDLLRMMLWLESIKLKERCKTEFHTIVYLYRYNVRDLDVKTKQNYLSKLLLDFKYEHGADVLLIPMAANLDAGAIDMMREGYGIRNNDLPTIIIDEKRIIRDFVTLNDLEKLVFQSSKT